MNGDRLLRWPKWALAVGAVGAGLRLRQFFSCRSLWYDEALFALNVLHRSFKGLFQPLDYHQGAPVGFLLLEKLSTLLAGKGELALRTIPLLAGIVSLVVFYEVARLYLSAKAVPIAFILFSLSKSLIYYSSEAKQYSTDVLVTLALLHLVFKLSEGSLSRRKLFDASGVGALAIWFSHPASFVLAGAATVLIIDSLLAGNAQKLRRLMWIFFPWAGSWALCYSVSLRFLGGNTVLLDYWRGTFPPHALS
ncbi:MAG: glycosyltransferase family 39 protein, partial [Candidatus Sulfotelmatobacter sp.]